ncbi:MAG: PQQ-like beta-propeller repeat protein [Planctomycetaceae bacterium]|jgi:outer membrane protein assembly factor BamB|nr:PQQ-like beta-propeller repeat protein [Planctomycetaceae bacterium]MBT6154081.1 PQQ-like beta-propeller repeat protein [Planctomycetaceae bacterium]MBT6486364.1 PQQ-like beta-propeller repeat protein [Planctomycetaceae bacterium]MBT6494825.1 PQQ-like beta-propeller repeat protein [Planctomycetaceae bacterium]
MKTLASALALFVVLASNLHAGDWPAWRGPTGQGYSDDTAIPLTWSDSENVKWKVPLEFQGNSTPIVSGKKIFLTQANNKGATRSLLCLSRTDGKLLWKKDVTHADKELSWNPNWYSNSSPVTDGKRVIVSFASAGMYCYDMDGKELWKRTDLGSWQHKFGSGSSPIIYGDTAILWCGPNEKQGRNFLLSVNKETGKTVWEHDEKFGSWGTPLIVKHDGKDQLLLGTNPMLKGIDPKTGKELWKCGGHNKFVYASPLFGNGTVVGMTGYNGQAFAVTLGGKGDITSDRLWLHPRATQRVGSGVVIDNHIYIVEESGIPHCYDLNSGAEVWQVKKRPNGGKTWGSMVYANARLYVLMKNGSTLVFAAGPKYELLATNKLAAGAATNSSLAVSDGEIFLRTFKNLYCITQK